jgi:hypothetical protein
MSDLFFSLLMFSCYVAAPIVAYHRGQRYWWLHIVLGWMAPELALFIAFMPIFRVKNIPKSVLQTKLDRNALNAQLRAIEMGDLPAIEIGGIVPGAGETFFWRQRAQYGELLHRGHNAVDVVWGPTGSIYVSDQRIAFKSGQSFISAGYERIFGYDAYPDGLGLQIAEIGMVRFLTGDECLGVLFEKVIKRLTALSAPSQLARMLDRSS